MATLMILIVLQGLLGAFDTLYHHEFTERLTWRPGAVLELRIHALRNLFYGVIFLTFGWLAWLGAMAWVFGAILVLEVLLTLWDFVVEDRSRDLPASERITHALLALNYGAILMILLPVLADWAARPSGLVLVDHGYWSWLMTAFAVAVAFWAVRDALRARRLARWRRPPPPRLPAGLPERLSVLVTGGTGFIGARLCAVLIAGGHRVTVLTRDKRKARDLRGRVTLIDSLDDLDDHARFDVIVNLAGEPVAAGRWTRARKREILDSRLEVTGALVRFIARARHKPGLLLSASAIGFYGTDPERAFGEGSPPNPAFTHEVCRAWEAKALEARRFGLRVCLLRIGIVLGSEGGALAQMLPPFEFALGGAMGSGRQWMSWIHRDDVIGLILHAITEVTLCGPINATAPAPVRNAAFATALGRALGRPALIPMPAFTLRLLFGAMADEVLLGGQQVLPRLAEASGYRFAYPELDGALAEILGRPGGVAPLSNTAPVSAQ